MLPQQKTRNFQWVGHPTSLLPENQLKLFSEAGFFFCHPGGIWSLVNSFLEFSHCQVWLGTSDDWIGTSDRPTKEQGLFRGWTYGFLHRLCVFNTLALAMKRQYKRGAHARTRAQVRGIFFACSNTSVYSCTGKVYTLAYLHILTWLHPTHTHSRALSMYTL